MRATKSKFVLAGSLVSIAMLFAACVSSAANPGATAGAAATTAPAATNASAITETTSASAQGGKIALLLPETKTTRYETADRPDFEAKFMALCPDCQIIY